MERQPVESVMDTTLAHIKEMLDVDTVVGKPVFSEGGTVIIPLSRLGVGFAAGAHSTEIIKGRSIPSAAEAARECRLTRAAFL